jgi:hypothetical protein
MFVFEHDKATPASFPVVPIMLLKALRQEQCHGLREERNRRVALQWKSRRFSQAAQKNPEETK